MSKADFLNGAIWSLSTMCDDCNYVSIYGVEKLDVSKEMDVQEIKEILLKSCRDISGDVEKLELVSNWKAELRRLADLWITSKMLRGSLSKESKFSGEINSLLEFIEESVELDKDDKKSIIERVYSTKNLKGGYDVNILLFIEDGIAYYFYFTFSD